MLYFTNLQYRGNSNGNTLTLTRYANQIYLGPQRDKSV